jgi:hypothetical protein
MCLTKEIKKKDTSTVSRMSNWSFISSAQAYIKEKQFLTSGVKGIRDTLPQFFFYTAPIEVILLLLEDVETKTIIDWIDSDDLLRYRLYGERYPEERQNAKALVDKKLINPTPKVMLMLIEREFHITGTEEKIVCLDQFREKLKKDFDDWRTKNEGRTIAGVKNLFLYLFFYEFPAEEEDMKTVIRFPLVFRLSERGLLWNSFISYARSKEENWEICALAQNDIDFSAVTPQSGHQLIAGKEVAKNILRSFYVSIEPPLPFILVLADSKDDAGKPKNPYTTYYVESLHEKRTDAASQAISIESDVLEYIDDKGNAVIPFFARFGVMYVDYDTIVYRTPKGLEFLYRSAPIEPSDKVTGQLSVPASMVFPSFYFWCRMDMPKSTKKFGFAILYDEDQRARLDIVRSNAAGVLRLSNSYRLPYTTVRLEQALQEEDGRVFYASNDRVCFFAANVSGGEVVTEYNVVELDTDVLTIQAWPRSSKRKFWREDGLGFFGGQPIETEKLQLTNRAN